MYIESREVRFLEKNDRVITSNGKGSVQYTYTEYDGSDCFVEQLVIVQLDEGHSGNPGNEPEEHESRYLVVEEKGE